MSIKGSYTTADYIEWNEATNLVRKLYRDGDYMMSLFVGIGIFTGLRVSDIRRLTWAMLLNDEGQFEITEKKTQKHRIVKVNPQFRLHVEKCMHKMGVTDLNTPCLISNRNTVISTQRLNVRLKEVRGKYKVRCKNISCHSLRKCFGRACYVRSGEKAEMALMQLSMLFNHSSPCITRRYLGITREEMLSAYDTLDF